MNQLRQPIYSYSDSYVFTASQGMRLHARESDRIYSALREQNYKYE